MYRPVPYLILFHHVLHVQSPIFLTIDEIASDKSQQMAKLLDFQANPTRKALLEDIVAKGVLNDVAPEIAALYALLETKFNPLG